MINQLSIRNYAIIDNLEINFSTGFTTITGETGAGKSIILGALNLLLGHRFESVNFKDKSVKCVVEGVFHVSHLDIKDFFLDNNLDYEDNVLIRREFLFEGKSRSFVNDSPVKLDLLKNLSFFLVDIHSQHQNLLIQDENFQINLLDNFCKNQFDKFKISLFDYSHCFNSLQKLKMDMEYYQKILNAPDLDIIYNQELVNEVESLNLELNEKEKLENDHKKLTNIHKIKNVLSEVLFLLETSDSSIITNLNSVNSKLSDIKEYDSEFVQIVNRLNANIIDVNDILMELHTLNHDLGFNSNKLEIIENRLNAINSLERKMNVFSFQDLIDKSEKIKLKLKESKSVSENINKIKIEIEKTEEKLIKISNSLTSFRKQSARDLSNFIKQDLLKLGVNNPDLCFDFSKLINFSPSGLDKINLLFSSNKGYDLKLITNIASGGEIARLMLCVKKYLFQITKFSTIIFDEIDSGVSGDIGRKMGRILQKMSTQGQVICITHLPQIASLGDTHYKVLKSEINGITTTKIIKLQVNDRIQEIARMLSGDEVNEEAVANAKKMIDI